MKMILKFLREMSLPEALYRCSQLPLRSNSSTDIGDLDIDPLTCVSGSASLIVF